MDEKELSLSLSLWCNNNGVFFWCRPDRSFVSSTERKKKGGGLFDFFFLKERDIFVSSVGGVSTPSYITALFLKKPIKKSAF